jgi:predicted acyltransferase
VPVQEWIYRTWCVPLGPPAVASLVYAAGFTLVMFLLAWGLWKKGWFLKV